MMKDGGCWGRAILALKEMQEEFSKDENTCKESLQAAAASIDLIHKIEYSFRDAHGFDTTNTNGDFDTSTDESVLSDLKAEHRTKLTRLSKTQIFKDKMEKVKRITYKLCRGMTQSTDANWDKGKVIKFQGTNGIFTPISNLLVPPEWNDTTVPLRTGNLDTFVPTYILPVPQILARGGEKGWGTYILGGFMTILLLAFTAFSVLALVAYEYELNGINSLIVPSCLFAIKTIIPKLVEFSVRLEEWDDPEFEVNLIMMRTYLLKLSNIFVLYNRLQSTGTDTESRCSEAVAGMMFFQMIVTNSVLTSLSNFLSYGAFWWGVGRTEIRQEIVAQLYVDMNYNQALFLMGMIYVPALPLVFFLLNYLEMFVLYLCFKWFCKLAEKPFEPKNKNSTYMYLFVTCGISLMTFALFLYTAPNQANSTANECGPWAFSKLRYECISDWFNYEMPDFVSEIFKYVLNPMLVYVIVLFLSTVYTFNKASLTAVRHICVDTQWQLRMLTNMMTKRMRSDRHGSMKSEGETKQRITSLESALGKMNEKHKRDKRDLVRMKDRISTLRDENDERNSALQEVCNLNDQLAALKDRANRVDELEQANAALKECLQAALPAHVPIPRGPMFGEPAGVPRSQSTRLLPDGDAV